jgi:hypothetical protein
MKYGLCTLSSNSKFNQYWPKQKIIERPSEVKDKCTHLNIYQKTQTTINTCKAITNKETCRSVSIKTHQQRFGQGSNCASGGTTTNKGTGYNEYTCLDECKKAGSSVCNNFEIRTSGQCILYSGTCSPSSLGSSSSRVFEVYHKNYKLVGSNK